MRTANLNHYRELLLAMRKRVNGEVAHMIESIQEESSPTGNGSNVPVHFGDLATSALDADVRILETEQGILGEINMALLRIEDGTYGTCTECGEPVGDERLESLPHASCCVACAFAADSRKNLPR